MADDERLLKLKEKYNQLKQANGVLKKGLLDKQEECARLEQQLKERDSTIREQLEEIDHLQFQNGRMSKQLGTLTAQVEESRKTQTQSSWSMGGLISGKQQEAMQKAESDLAVLRDELMMKIQENEELHMRVFEAQRQHDEEAERLRDTEATKGRDLERYAAQLKSSKEEVERLSAEGSRMAERISTLDNQLFASAQLSQSLREQLDKERLEATETKTALQSRLAQWVPFDWTCHDLWTGFGLGSQQGRLARQREEALTELSSAVREACQQSSGALQKWPSAVLAGGDEEPASRLRIRSKVAEFAQQLSQSVLEAAPALADLLAKSGLALTPFQKQELRRQTQELLQIHRRWVLYQSLLLLHDWQSTAAARSSQEEALAQSFVDCLWRLHRCVRSLVARLRVASLVPGLSTESRSSCHFALARRCLKKAPAPVEKEAGKVSSAGAEAALRLGLMQRSLGDVCHCWRALSRCLSSWAAARGGTSASAAGSVSQESGGTVVELLGYIHGLCGCLTERLMPIMERLSTQVSSAQGEPMLFLRPSKLARLEPHQQPESLQVLTKPYLRAAESQLAKAPGAIGMEEAVHTLALARRLADVRTQLLSELQQQTHRLQVVSNEKTQLSGELSTIQDNHALLQSNYDALRKASAPVESAIARQETPGDSGEMLLTSRQRALLGSMAVSAQESSGMRQHGFFVDVVSLAHGEVSLASGPPRPEALESWELAIRKVYEQHMYKLEKQVVAADNKALETGLHVHDYCGQIQRQEEEKNELASQVEAGERQLQSLREDMEATRKNYDGQLGMLTEHICTLSLHLSEKDASLATLQAHKVLCGRCGMWNTMGKLLSDSGKGTCQTCGAKVLSTD